MDAYCSSVSAQDNEPLCRQPEEARTGDSRRNLYVLGLPFDLTKYVLNLLSTLIIILTEQ
jgi:hypothetical protein